MPVSTIDATSTGSTGTVMVSGNMPAFSAYANAGVSIPSGVWTKVPLQLEYFDTNNSFDNVTNYRFTPTVAGYYQVNGAAGNGAAASGVAGSAIYKNGTLISACVVTNGGQGTSAIVSCVAYLNGSTDYVELFGFQNSGGAVSTTGNSQTTFNGCLVRAA